MRFATSIFMLLAVVCTVISAYFIGHGLVVSHEGETWPWLAAAGMIAAGVVFGVIYLKMAKNDPQPTAHGHGTHAHTHADGTVHTHPHGAGHHH
ncbi:MAG TPA: hypothetical protein VF039_09800 [Longimicrobiales bacterium]